MKNNTIQVFAKRASVMLVLSGLAVTVLAEPVPPPPLPPGSSNVSVDAGLDPDEVARHKRAHKHSSLEKKNPTRDDSLVSSPVPKSAGKPKSKDPTLKSKAQ